MRITLGMTRGYGRCVVREIRMLRTNVAEAGDGVLRDGLKAPGDRPKAPGQLQEISAPVATAPVFDPTGERRLETGPRRGVRHRHCESRRQQLPPSAYRYRASCRLYTQACKLAQHGGD